MRKMEAKKEFNVEVIDLKEYKKIARIEKHEALYGNIEPIDSIIAEEKQNGLNKVKNYQKESFEMVDRKQQTNI